MKGVLGLVGAGAAGPALARKLRDAGWSIGVVASRRLESAEAAVAFIGAGRASNSNRDALEGADLVILAVPDRVIAPVAKALAAAGAPGALVLHLSGALSSAVLAPLREAGHVVGSLHPLQTFPDPESAYGRLDGTWMFYEGDDPVGICGIAEDLGGRPVPIDAAGKVLYHAGAASACNLAAAMIDVGLQLFEAAGIGRDVAVEALLPLVRGTVENIAARGLPEALTGPVERGDLETVRNHVNAIAALSPGLLAPYRAVSRHAVAMAVEKGALPQEQAGDLLRLLREPAD